ncbi:L,D-transpeptidase family protein [Flavobacterium sp.]|uniref:L,D-transpeptidase family protein n=1 Tax=Flavobacterium sp. TaxID=239 RepID=UPI0026195608|nr:L,D-transpeptidase family protein [Flavobacterium sp.]
MKPIKIVAIYAFISLSFFSCKKKFDVDKLSIDETKSETFYERFPEFAPFEEEMNELYEKHQNHFIWYDNDGRVDFAEVLFNRANQIKAEGIASNLPYRNRIGEIFDLDEKKKPETDNDMLISAMYFFYTKNVLEGLDPDKSKQTGWYLPREKSSYVDYLDQLIKDPDLIKKDESEMIGQYYNLRKGLQRYREIEKKGGWGIITWPSGKKSLKPGDNDPAIAQIRRRLAAVGDLSTDSKSTVFDGELKSALAKFQQRNGQTPANAVTPELVKEMNVSVADRIKTVVVNMERCRWIDPDILDSKELVAVNIPSYRLVYFRDGKPALESNVVVGKELNKTVVFSGKMSYLVFSPYWNIPPSIIKKEIKPGIDADAGYLEKHNMEWNNGQVRQKPGENNSLGLVKFMFPNTNNIYLHDTPAKSLFGRDERALSHGCVRVEKARDLAIKILDNDKNWSPEKIDEAMHAGKERQYALKRKIPVYIAYFTARADENGNISFYNDIYQRDNRLAHLLYNE